MRNNLRSTLNGIFDLYHVAAKKFYGLSLTYSIISSIFAVVISSISCLVVLKIIGGGPYESENMLEGFLMNPLTIQRFQDIAKAVLILNFGIYGIFLLREEKTGLEDKYSFKELMKGISKEDWTQYAVLLGVILLINGVFFKYIFDTSSDNTGLVELIDIYDPANKQLKFYNWANSIIELIKTYLPYFFAMLLILYNYDKKLNTENLKKYKAAFLSALILCFCIDILSSEVVNYVSYYLINLIKIPFVNELIPGIFGFLIGVLITAFFYLGFAATIAYPFKFEKEKINKHEK